MIFKLLLLISPFINVSSSLSRHDAGPDFESIAQICNMSIDPFIETIPMRQASIPSSSPQTAQDCYPCMYYSGNETNGVCECSDIPYQAVLCDPAIPRTSILECYCMTYNYEQNVTEVGLCLYGCVHNIIYDNYMPNVYYLLPQNIVELNMYTCGEINRDSTLCGKCKAGYSPLVYSYDMSCMNCTGMTYNWIKYIAVAYIPLTLFFIIIVIVRFDGTSPLVKGLVSVCQCLVSPICIRTYLMVVRERPDFDVPFKVFSTLYGVWNLDFFRTIISPLCMEILPLQALALDYAIAFYPLLLILIAYVLISLYSRDVRIVVWLWKPFHHLFHRLNRNWDLEGSIVKAFATFFVLSYLKILNVTVDLLVYTEKYELLLGSKNYQVKYVLYYDPTLEYFQGQHLYYGITAMFVGFFFVLLPLVFLVIYPMRYFQKCLNIFGIRRQPVDAFVNCFQGYYKDGTNGTRDCRYFSVTFFLIQIILMSSFVITKSIYCFLLGAIVTVVVMFVVVAVQPYKEQFKTYTLADSFMLSIVALVFITATAVDEASVKSIFFRNPSIIFFGVLECIPALYMIGLIIWLIFVKKKLHRKLCCICSNVKDYEEFHNTDGLPDRIENPRIYQGQGAPLLDMSHENGCQTISYGSLTVDS